MHAIAILMILLFLLLFILTRETRIKIVKYDTFRIELHMQILALLLYKEKREHAKSDQKKRPLSREYKEVIIKALMRLLREGTLRINKLLFPSGGAIDDPRKVLRPVRYKILLASLLACLETKTSKLYFSDDVIILSPDITNLQYDITVSCRLYQFLRSLAALTIGLLRERGTKRVRE